MTALPLRGLLGFGLVLVAAGCSADAEPAPPGGMDADARPPLDGMDGGEDTDDSEAPDGDTDDAPETTGDGDTEPAAPIHRVEVLISQQNWDTIHADPSQHIEVPITIVMNDDEPIANAELELHGGFARTLPKKSYRVRVPEPTPWDLFGDGLELQQRYVLQAAWIDPTMLRNMLTMEAARAVGGLAPRFAFAELFVNGEYHGLYTLIERIDKHYLAREGLQLPAHLYKAESHHANWGAKDDPLAGYDVKLGDGTPPDDLDALLQACSYTDPTHEAFEASVAPLLALDDFMTLQLVHTYALDRDAYTKNYYLHAPLPGPGPFRIVSWDADATWGNDWNAEPVAADDSVDWHGWDQFSPRLFAVPEYRAQYLERYAEALAGPLVADLLEGRVRDLAADIDAAVALDLAAWGRDDVDFAAEIERLVDVIWVRHLLMTDVIAAEGGTPNAE